MLTFLGSANSTSKLLNSQQTLEKTLLLAINDTSRRFEKQIRELETDFTKAKEHKPTETKTPESGGTENNKTSIELVEEFVRNSQDKLSSLFSDMDKNMAHVLPVFARERFVQSLDFLQIEDRYDRIDKAHKETLQWILKPNEQPGNAEESFTAWLASSPESSDVYWVTGVPGSGKSTLMRFLSDAPQVKEILCKTAGEAPVIVLSCFFWHPGTELQKSLEGLLRTLTRQAIVASHVDDSTLQMSCPTQWQSCLYDRTLPQKWPVPDLKALLGGIMSSLSRYNNVILFIDGLDEYGTDRKEREELVDYLLEVQRQSKVKMCLSSRPWNEFGDRLGRYPHIKLEDVNKRDMKIFVETTLAPTPTFQELARVAGDQVSNLFEQLVDKSSGVFLWLRLVTKRLQISAEEGKSLRKLKEILDEIPPDLDEFFKHMLERIDHHERVQASKIFQIVIHPGKMPDLMMLSFTDEEDPNFALSPALESETAPEILSRVVALRRRIDSRCMDLLICPPAKANAKISEGLNWEYIQVDYLHRTVRDFLVSPTSSEVLRSYTVGWLDVWCYKRNAMLAQMLFLRKFIASSTPPSPNQCGVQTALFSTCMSHILPEDYAVDEETKSTFESAVDNVEPFLTNFEDTIRHSRFDNVFRTTHGRYTNSSGSPFADPDRALSVFRVYSWNKVSGRCRYLFMAFLADMGEYPGHYIKEIQASHDIQASQEVWAVFRYILADAQAEHRRIRGRDLELLSLILQSGIPLEGMYSALTVFTEYHTTVALFKDGTEDEAKVTKMLLRKVNGLAGNRSQLKDFRYELEKLIRNAYDKRTAEALLEIVNTVSKTWKNTSIVDTLLQQITSGQPAAASSATHPSATVPKRSLLQKVFSSKS